MCFSMSSHRGAQRSRCGRGHLTTSGPASTVYMVLVCSCNILQDSRKLLKQGWSPCNKVLLKMNPKLQWRPRRLEMPGLWCIRRKLQGPHGTKLRESWRSRVTQGHSSLKGAKGLRCYMCSCRILFPQLGFGLILARSSVSPF